MDRGEYWERISRGISDYLCLLGLKAIDIYLVGSSVRKKVESVALASDIDSVILISDKLSLGSLRNARLRIHSCLVESCDASLYHFKLFDEEEIELLGRYDGFRLFEFQLANISLFGTRNIMDHSPLVNYRSFCNSIFVQTVYEFLEDDTNMSLEDIINSKVRERIERNKEILRIAGGETEVFEGDAINFCANRDKLFAFFLDVASKGVLRRKSMFWLIQWYFKRFRHEYINKYYVYMDNIERRLARENTRGQE